jgi:hypothetical protein
LFEGRFGRDIRHSTFEDQLYNVHAELQSNEKRAGDLLAKCVTAAEAAEVICRYYERPADPDGDSRKRRALAEQILAEYGGAVGANAPVATSDISAASPKPPEKPMGALALLQLFGPILSGMIPQIQPLLKPGMDKVDKFTGIAQVVLDTINKATGQPNLQGSIEAMADPTVKQAVQQAVVSHPEIIPMMQIGEVGGGIAAARKADLEVRPEGVFWKTSAVFYVSLLLLPMVYWLVGSLIVGGYGQILAAQNVEIPPSAQALLALFGASWTGEARSGGFNLVVGLVLGGICGVYYGVSVTQARQASQQQAQSDKQ